MLLTTEIDSSIEKCTFHTDFCAILVNEFTEKSAQEFTLAFNRAHNSGQTVIPVIIDSYGGYVDSLVSMISDIQNSKIPVATVVKGKAMSCGAVLMTFGTKGYRYIDPNSRVMVHEIASGSWGKAAEIAAWTEETKRLNEQIFTMMSQNCGQKKDYFFKQMKKRNNADWLVTPADTLKMGMADKMYIPSFKRKVVVEYDFE